MGCNAPQEGHIVANLCGVGNPTPDTRHPRHPTSTTCGPLPQTCENFRMQQLRQWPLADRQRIKGVFTDIDDTLTTDGAITPDALAALHDLKAAGLKVIAITGRPAGWSEPFARDWPVAAIVAENGAVLLRAVQAEPFDGLRTGPVEAQDVRPNPSTLRQAQDRPSSGRTVFSKMYQQDETTRAATS